MKKKSRILYTLISIFLSGLLTSSYADLGIADTTLGTTYKAKCGANLKPCTINFSEDRLIINNTNSITRDQFNSIVTARTCRQRSILLPMLRSCYKSQYDNDVTINYIGADNSKKSALIVFRPGYLLQGGETYSKFIREAQTWTQDIIRPIGPSIEVKHLSR